MYSLTLKGLLITNSEKKTEVKKLPWIQNRDIYNNTRNNISHLKWHLKITMQSSYRHSLAQFTEIKDYDTDAHLLAFHSETWVLKWLIFEGFSPLIFEGILAILILRDFRHLFLRDFNHTYFWGILTTLILEGL